MAIKGEKVLPIYVEDEMKNAYIDYAMSVIVGRALPDVRDGLKPVHRRILYAMYQQGLTSNRPFRKCAGVVGEVIKSYHPHGDAAVYESIVRMVQPFSLRYPLIEGQGNFGSIDGDPAAAYRYTEARLAPLAEELLEDIYKETVDFVPNFDESLSEPVVLPAKAPNLLINGSAGIAVGMATNIPPQNLKEVVDGIVRVIANPEISLLELMEVIKGPDFPTGGLICGREGIKEAYSTGKGHVVLRAKANIEPLKGGREAIIVTEIPYQVNKASLIEAIATLVREKKIDGISDLRDESDREGMRIVIELQRDKVAQVVLNQLYKHTQMQTTFGIIMLALVENRPQILNLKEMIEAFIDHRKQVIVRRTKFDLDKAEKRAHLLEGLKIALSHLDEVIRIIKRSKSPENAEKALIARFDFSGEQAKAILEMKLQRITSLEREKIDNEYLETIKLISHLKSILASPQKVLEIIKEELLSLKEKYGDERRSTIVGEVGEITIEDLIPEEDVVIAITHSGYIKRTPIDAYRQQRLGGKGISAMETKEEDFVEHLFITTTHNYLLFFTNRGKVYGLRVHEIPEAGRQARGKAIVNLIRLSQDEVITSTVPVKEFNDQYYLSMATKKGMVKRSRVSLYKNVRASGLFVLTLEKDDELVGAKLTDGNEEIILATEEGKALQFPEKSIRDMGRTAKGVKGIALSESDKVVAMETVKDSEETLLTVTAKGYGKRSFLSQYRVQRRGGRGLINIKITERNGGVVGVRKVSDDEEVMIITAKGMIIRSPAKEIRAMGRNTQGNRLIKLDPDDSVVSIATVSSKEE